jgi:hypothetical protein
MQDEIKIFLTPFEAEMFKSWQEFHSMFELMVKQGVFDIKFGKAILNFANGELQNITKEEIVWKKT